MCVRPDSFVRAASRVCFLAYSCEAHFQSVCVVFGARTVPSGSLAAKVIGRSHWHGDRWWDSLYREPHWPHIEERNQVHLP